MVYFSFQNELTKLDLSRNLVDLAIDCWEFFLYWPLIRTGIIHVEFLLYI